MKFGPVPTTEGAGAILAHTLRTASRVLKKGRVLSALDLSVLRDAGYEEIVVARLEAGDVSEDQAAAALGAALETSGVNAAPAFTGRCNLYAQSRGLFGCDRAGVDRLNGIDEAVTLATLPPDSVVEAGTMVATAKIIPFAVSATVLDRALHSCSADAPLLQIESFRPLRAGLILTELPGTRPAVLERASESQHTRLRRLGGEIAREIRCAHEVPALRAALTTLLGAGCDPILILGASAIVDRGDVVPAACLEAGASILRLGMPVDPGNLLLLAAHGSTALIGVPGCARSLKPSGFDAVLACVAADREIAGADLAVLGSGGLLKELPSRPQPREGPDVAGRGVAAIVLAAGQSRRMPDANKLLCEVEGVPMLRRVVDALGATELESLIVVTGHEADAIASVLGGSPVTFAHNHDYAQGMSASLRVGLESLPDDVAAALVCLGDMPWVSPAVIAALLAAFDPEDPRICVPVHERKRGNPVLWPSRYFAEMREITGDRGARQLLEEYADEITLVSVDEASVNIDIDTPEALAREGAR